MPALRTLALVAAALVPAFAASADELVWTNLTDYPAGLEQTDAGWSAIRIDGFSNRVAADDFILDKATRISRIEFWTVQLTDNPLLGIDWYIFSAGPKEGPPGDLIAFGANAPTAHKDTGLVNASFGTIYLEGTDVSVPLDAGHYFLAFRCVHQDDNKGNGCLTTYDQIGTSRGWWNFELSTEGQVGMAWNPMSDFNLKDNEWAFQIWGVGGAPCYPDFTGDGVLDLFDFLAYVNSFNAGEDVADCTGDGVLDLFDFLCFLNAFNGGC